MKKGMKQIIKQAGTAMLLIALTCGSALAQEQDAANQQKDDSSSKEEGNRNVMLNAASANGPREIQIGLPSPTSMYWKTEYLSPTQPIHTL